MTEGPLAERRSTPWLAAAVAAIALTPYATVTLPFQAALWIQGVLVVGILGVFLVLRARGLVRAALGAPGALRWGLVLYASAAMWGGVVGVASGNPARFVTTQFASMFLLPVAFLAFGADRPVAPDSLARGLGAAAAVALLLHLGAFLAFDRLLPPPGEPFRLCLRNDVGFTGVAVMGFLVATAWLRHTRVWAAAGACACLAVLVVGSMSRGAWAVAVLGLAVWAGLAGAMRLRSVVRTGAAVVVVLALGAVGAYRVGRRGEVKVALSLPAAETAPSAPAPCGVETHEVVPLGAGPQWTPIVNGMAFGARAIEVDACYWGAEGAPIKLFVEGRDADGRTLIQAPILREGRDAWARLKVVHFLPEGVHTIDIRVWTDRGPWLISDMRVRPLENTAAAWLRALSLRLGAAVAAVGAPVADPTLRYRWREWQAVRARWVEAGPWRLAIGQGLGVTFPFLNAGYDASGRRVVLTTASYIHDFYVFLGFKLGVAGFAAFAGLVLLAGWTLVRAVRERGRTWADWLVPAAAAAWVAYLAWSVTSPEILDFRVAPLWGALLAATGGGRHRPPEP